MACLHPVAALVPIPARTRTARVMRWTFERGRELLVCELGLDRDEMTYELTVAVPWGTRPSSEHFADIHSAIQRQLAMERLLLEEGWSLGRFETVNLAR